MKTILKTFLTLIVFVIFLLAHVFLKQGGISGFIIYFPLYAVFISLIFLIWRRRKSPKEKEDEES